MRAEDRFGSRGLTSAEHSLVAAVITATVVLGLVGFLNSFARVNAAAAPSFGQLAWTVPLGVDLGIAVFSALDIVLARLDLRARWLRLIPWSLVAATVYLNVAGERTLFGALAHGVLPALWVVAVEVGAHVLRVRAGLTSATRMDAIRRSRWLLAPASTLLLWRRMVLWEIRSYPTALARERQRLLALTDLQDRYGHLAWRWAAPRWDRALYRLGELTPVTTTTDRLPGPGTEPAVTAGPADWPRALGGGTTTRTGGRSTAGPRQNRDRLRRPATAGRAPDVGELLPVGRRIAADLEAAGRPLTRASLLTALRDAGYPTSNTRAGALLARLRTETPHPDHGDSVAGEHEEEAS